MAISLLLRILFLVTLVVLVVIIRHLYKKYRGALRKKDDSSAMPETPKFPPTLENKE